MMKCTAIVFSGRKNPEWEIKDEALKQQVIALLQHAEVTNKTVQNSVLGYAGFRLVAGDTAFELFNGIITQTDSGSNKSMIDHERTIEKLLLQSVPKKFAEMISAASSTSF